MSDDDVIRTLAMGPAEQPAPAQDETPPLSLLGPAEDCQRILSDLRLRATRAPLSGSAAHAHYSRLAARYREEAEAQYRKLFSQPINAIKADLVEASRRYNLVLRAVAKLEQALAASDRDRRSQP